MIPLECNACGRSVAFAAHQHPRTCICGGTYVDAGYSEAGRLRRERDHAIRVLAAVIRSAQRLEGDESALAKEIAEWRADLRTAQRLAREGRAEVLAAKLPEAWR